MDTHLIGFFYRLLRCKQIKICSFFHSFQGETKGKKTQGPKKAEKVQPNDIIGLFMHFSKIKFSISNILPQNQMPAFQNLLKMTNKEQLPPSSWNFLGLDTSNLFWSFRWWNSIPKTIFFVSNNFFRLFPIISISQKIFSIFFLTLEKIGIDEKVICYHSISN